VSSPVGELRRRWADSTVRCGAYCSDADLYRVRTPDVRSARRRARRPRHRRDEPPRGGTTRLHTVVSRRCASSPRARRVQERSALVARVDRP
jgi:hypothetical protein